MNLFCTALGLHYLCPPKRKNKAVNDLEMMERNDKFVLDSDFFHSGFLCLGSNVDGESNLSLAKRELETLPLQLFWGTLRWTTPIDFPNPALFANQVAFFRSMLDSDELREHFKRIERLCGRTPIDKEHGIVRIDIDLLSLDGVILKKKDWELDYVKSSVKELLTQKIMCE